MVPYGITLIPLEECLTDVDPTLLSPLYDNDVVFDGLISRSAAQLHLLMDRGSDQGYFHKPAKSHFIANNYEDKEVARQEFKKAGLYINCVDGIRYMGPYLGPREEKEAWVRPKVEAWTHRVRTLAKISKQCPQLAYDGLGILLHIK